MDESRMQYAGSEGKGLDEKLMMANRLKYRIPGHISLVDSGAVYRKNAADVQTLNSGQGQDLIVRLTGNKEFIYGPNCYLAFDIVCAGAESAASLLASNTTNFGIGFLNNTACAVMDRLLIEDRSGSEIERVDGINKAVRARLPWRVPQEYKGMQGIGGLVSSMQLLPYNAGAFAVYSANAPTNVNPFSFNLIPAAGGGANVAQGSKKRFEVPLWWFSDFFGQETFIPPELIGGMQIRITLASAKAALQINALIGTGTTVPATYAVVAGYSDANLQYTITNPAIYLDSYRMAPAIAQNIVEQSQKGLPFVYDTLYLQQGNALTSTTFNQQINKSVSRANKIWTVTQNTIADTSTVDNLGSQPLGYFQIQTKVGDWNAPNQVLQLGDVDSMLGVQNNAAELYGNNLQCTKGLGHPYLCPSVSYDEFRFYSRGAIFTDNRSFSTVAQNLEQSPHIGMSGVAVNNSRTATIQIRYAADNDNAAGKTILSWLQYTKLCASFPTRAVIKE
jgi:hypothetical protein